ncbi:pyruvate/2-oxoglutarate dehydrogenase complex, dehydrogenase component beta subunit [Halovivax asiaticus JCM 14624]|uniref:Pyruvate/2-oxoglutarate dehydrogenase complex, dehydrogenase component beta subunit n=1 Tax=Halovivax asiaticus JCM 14624 TaxID=1227490 RepID=M0BK13_9EURY|nr:alpha-ketoacid dehydrogenase subunit beta [Halovivax asiaticus]ELZ10817.1 pyruvate/2-oxoglutarate dehydrogenase complex, dehydrogenase component beta subunit [Halovivax asiaticus JCM 14624]
MSTAADGLESAGDDAVDQESDVATDTIDLDAYDGPTESLSLVEGVRDGLELELARDDSVVVLGEDVGTNGGVFRATEHLQDEFGPNRVIDTPLAESAIVGSSIGLALSGMRPVAEMQFMGFASPAYDQLVSHAAAMRSRSHGQFTLPMVVRMPYGGGIAAPEHHSESREAALVHEPGLKVVTPSTPTDAKGLIAAAVRDPDPVIVLEPKRLYRAFREDVPEEPYTVPIGEASVRREGEDVSLFTWGASTQPALAVAEDLAAENGIDVEVVDLRSLSPLDIDTIAESVQKTGRAAVVHEAPKTAGVGAEVVATINEEALYYLEAPVTRVTGFDAPVPLSTLEDFYLPQALRIREGVLEAVEA